MGEEVLLTATKGRRRRRRFDWGEREITMNAKQTEEKGHTMEQVCLIFYSFFNQQKIACGP